MGIATGIYRPAPRHALVAGVLAVLAVLAVLVLADRTLAAEEPRAPSLTIAAVEVSAHPTVTLVVEAPPTGPDGARSAGAFTVTEDSVPRPATSTALSTEELAIVIVLDTSGSMGTAPLAAARDAALGFVAAMPAEVRIAVLGFADEVVVRSELTTQRPETVTAIAGLEAEGDTALYDAIFAALDLLDEVEVTREAIVLLSDGEDTASSAPLASVLDRVRATEVTVHAIEFLSAGAGDRAIDQVDEREEAPGIAALSEVVRAAGNGSLVAAADAAALTEVCQVVAASLTNRFAVVYRSAATDGAEVEVTYRVDGQVLSARATLELPTSPTEPTAASDPGREPPREPEPAPAPEAAPSSALDPLRPAGWVEPWMAPAGIGVLVAGLLGGLLYLHGWRLTDRFRGRL